MIVSVSIVDMHAPCGYTTRGGPTPFRSTDPTILILSFSLLPCPIEYESKMGGAINRLLTEKDMAEAGLEPKSSGEFMQETGLDFVPGSSVSRS